MREPLARLRAGYGANPVHLLVLLGCFALAGYAVVLTTQASALSWIVVWFLGALISHDLVLFPIYALADRSASTVLPSRPRGHRALPVPPLNYLRLPTLVSGLLLLMFLPGIIRQGSGTYLAATGQTQQPFLARWLLITAALFFLSAISYAARTVHTRRNGRRHDAATQPVERRPSTPPPVPGAPGRAAGPNSAMIAAIFLVVCTAIGIGRVVRTRR